jgi:hypothetical protein
MDEEYAIKAHNIIPLDPAQVFGLGSYTTLPAIADILPSSLKGAWGAVRECAADAIGGVEETGSWAWQLMQPYVGSPWRVDVFIVAEANVDLEQCKRTVLAKLTSPDTAAEFCPLILQAFLGSLSLVAGMPVEEHPTTPRRDSYKLPLTPCSAFDQVAVGRTPASRKRAKSSPPLREPQSPDVKQYLCGIDAKSFLDLAERVLVGTEVSWCDFPSRKTRCAEISKVAIEVDRTKSGHAGTGTLYAADLD